MKASRPLVLVAASLLTGGVNATSLKLRDSPFVWMRATLSEQAAGMLLEGSIRRTAPRTVRSLRGHVHLYLDDIDGREFANFAVPYRPAVLSLGGRASHFSVLVPAQDRPVAGGRLEHHLTAGD
ncbi:MAG: hypothetical protein AB7O21_06655 [Gammaproteobacteria bacterium]